jgi:hypothetical protein
MTAIVGRSVSTGTSAIMGGGSLRGARDRYGYHQLQLREA